MNLVHIDFAPRTLIRAVILVRPFTWFAGLIGGVMLLSAAIVALNIVQRQHQRGMELKRLEAKLAERSGRRPAVNKTAVPVAQAEAVNKAIAQLNLPWRELLDSIEAATSTSIALLALEPNAKQRSLKGMAEAKTSDDMIAYVESLKKQRFFDTVILTRHEINELDPNKPLRFQFEATWNEVIP